MRLRLAGIVLLLGFAFLPLVVSCNGFRKPFKTSLDVIHGQVQGLRVTLKDVCKPTLDSCIEREENPCEALERCFRVRERVLLVLAATEQSVQIGYQGLEVAATEDDLQKVAQAIGMATQHVGEVLVLVQRFREGF